MLATATALTIPHVLIDKIRRWGFIHEGYCPKCDAYECTLKIGPFQKVLSKQSFTHLGKIGLGHLGKVTTERLLTQRAARDKKEDRSIIIARPGVFMVFKDLLDLQQRIHEIYAQPGYAQSAHVAWFVTNKGTGVFSSMPCDRFEYARKLAGVETAEERRVRLNALRRREANKAKAYGPPSPAPAEVIIDASASDLPPPELLVNAA